MTAVNPRLAVFTTTLCGFAQVGFAQEAPVHSFQQLRVNAGQQLIVKTEDGKTIRGSVVSLVGSQLEIDRRRWSFKKELLLIITSVRR
jgi:hypothetical protein